MPGIEYAMRFPAVLREALQSDLVKLPNIVQTNFGKIHGFRGVKIKKGEGKRALTRADFNSQIEQHQTNPSLLVDLNNWGSYSCSCFTSKEALEIGFHLPRKGKGIAEGSITDKYGPIIHDHPHVHWFLYDDADPSSEFSIIEVCDESL